MASCSCGWAFVISKPYELAAPGRLLAHNTHTSSVTKAAHADNSHKPTQPHDASTTAYQFRGQEALAQGVVIATAHDWLAKAQSACFAR